MTPAPDLLLVSGSPRRRELLHMLGVKFSVFNADIDETRRDNEAIESYVNRLAREKALAGLDVQPAGIPRLGADTIVVLDNAILGKPVDRSHAAQMLSDLSGRKHTVWSAVAVARDAHQVGQCLNRTEVEFGNIPDAWIEQYCSGAEPMDKAGAYAIQGLAAQWVRHINGSFSGVMGLPVYETAELLREAGVPMGADRS